MAVLGLVPRQYGYYGYGYGYRYRSPWANYGRWILLGAIILAAFLIFLLFSCITARRRRRAGIRPFPLTGWAAGRTPPGHAPAQYTGGPPQPYYNNAGNDYSQQNPPTYSAPPNPPPSQNVYGNGNQGYFGGQQSGIELQQPNNSYQPPRGDEPVYGAPAGPPPGKKGSDGFIR